MSINLVTAEDLLRDGFIKKRIKPCSDKITIDILKENGLINEVENEKTKYP